MANVRPGDTITCRQNPTTAPGSVWARITVVDVATSALSSPLLPTRWTVTATAKLPGGGTGALCSIDRLSAAGASLKHNLFHESLPGCGIRWKSSNSTIVNNTWNRSLLTRVEVAALPNDGGEGPLIISNVTVEGNAFVDTTFKRSGDPEVGGWAPPCAFSKGVDLESLACLKSTDEQAHIAASMEAKGRGACSAASFVNGASSERRSSWADWLVTVLVPNPPGPAWWNDSSRVWLHEAVPQLDLLDWGQGQQWDRAGFFRSRGVAVTTKTDYEYEETFEFTNDEALSYYNGSGIAIDELGHPVNYAGYPPGDPFFTTLNGPRWRETIVQGVLRNGGYYGDAVGQDNIGSTLNKIAATWDNSTNARFREWLASSRCSCSDVDCNSPPLREVLSDPDFQVRDYLAKLRAQTGTKWNSTVGCSMLIGSESCCAGPCLERLERLVTDTLLHEYIRASYVFELRNWAEAVTSTKEAARIAGRKEPLLWGNQW